MTMAHRSVRVDGQLAASASDDPARDQAMLRAYAIERAVDYGCALEDVLKLHRRVEAGQGWSGVALQLADDNAQRAAFEARDGRLLSVARFRLNAAAACRLAQAGLEHDPASRLNAYERQADHFRAALAEGGAEYLVVEHGGKPHGTWLFAAPGLREGGAAVVVCGGADGWCEAFHTSVPFYLERGLSVCLLELPGQGLARLRHGSFLGAGFTRVVSKVLDVLIARGAGAQRLGIVGHSAGGSLALAAAAADPRIRACCSNGGSVDLREGFLKFPRVLQRFGRMMGERVAEAEVLEFIDQLRLEKGARTMPASLLCLQGGKDPLVADVEAQRLVELRGTASATLEYWPEGGHCLYNHALERNCVLTDWFATQLACNTDASSTTRRSS